MDDIVPTSQETTPLPDTPVVRIESIWGGFPLVTALPTFVPKNFQQSFAINTAKESFNFYDRQTNNWNEVGSSTPWTNLVDGATPALDASLGSNFYLAAAGDRTIAIPTNPNAGQKIVISHNASGGARTLSLNTGAGGFRFGSDITGLTQTASGKTDYIGCIYNALSTYWDVVAYTKNF